MKDDAGSQAGWYAVGGAVGTAGITIWSVGFAKSPPSQELEFLGLIAFVVGLFITIAAMPRRQKEPKPGAAPGNHSAHPRHRTVMSSRLILMAASGLLVIVAGGFAIYHGQNFKSQANKVSTSSSSTPTDSTSSSSTPTGQSSGTSATQGVLPVVYTCTGQPVRKPSSYMLACASGDTLLTSVTWSMWTAGQAFGAGQFSQNNCIPNCADGSYANIPVQVSLSLLAENTTSGQVYFRRLIIIGSGGEFPITYQLGQNGTGLGL